MKRKIVILCVLSGFAGLTLLTAPAGAGEWMTRDRKARWEKKRSALYAEIGLSPEQESALKENRRTYLAEMKKIYAGIKDKREAVRRELRKPELDLQRVRQLHGEFKELKAQKDDRRLEGILEVRGILTAEQFSRFLDMKDRAKEGRQQKRYDRKGGVQ